MKGAYLGPRHSEDEIEAFLKSRGLPHKKHLRHELPEAVAELLAAGKIIGLHQGRMEFGPRALGGRSIIGDPRLPEMQTAMNLKIKYRESHLLQASCANELPSGSSLMATVPI